MTDAEILAAAAGYRRTHMLMLVLAGNAGRQSSDYREAADLAEAELVRLLRNAASNEATYRGTPISRLSDEELVEVFKVTRDDPKAAPGRAQVAGELRKRGIQF